MTFADWQALGLTLTLASLTTLLLCPIGLALAWWLAAGSSWARRAVQAVIALPLVLPPTVLGFYFLWAFAPTGGLGQLLTGLAIPSPIFTFPGLVLASIWYSLPFMVLPLRDAFSRLSPPQLDSARTLGASEWQLFWRVALPLSKAGLVSALVLSFAHSVGEFGIVLMIGGNIPGQTRVLSMVIYDYTEAMQYQSAHLIALGLLTSAFAVLLWLYRRQESWAAPFFSAASHSGQKN